MEDRILTMHPQGKKGVNISRDKYDKIKSYILEKLGCQNIISYKELDSLAKEELSDVFTGSVGWYLVTIKLDLEARGIIERVSMKGGHGIRLKID